MEGRTLIRLAMAALVAIAAATSAAAQRPGTLDMAFGVDGQATLPLDVYVPPSGGLAMLADEERRLWTIATARMASEQQAIGIARLLPDGAIDASFPALTHLPVGHAHVAVRDAAWQPDGKLVVVGQAQIPAGSGMLACRFTRQGAIDLSFGDGNGCRTLAFGNAGIAHALVVQADGRIVLAGSAMLGGRKTAVLVGLTPAGQLDADFGALGLRPVPTSVAGEWPSAFHALAMDDAGALVAAGSLERSAADHDVLLARVDAHRHADIGFGAGGYVVDNVNPDDTKRIALATAVHLRDDGRVLVAGRVETRLVNEPVSDFNVFVVGYGANGALDPDFIGSPNVFHDTVYFLCHTPDHRCDAKVGDLTMMDDGRILIAGALLEASHDGTPEQQRADTDLFVLRLRPNGLRDTGFGTQGTDKPGVARVAFDRIGGRSEDLGRRVLIDGASVLVAGLVRAPGNEGDSHDIGVARLTNGDAPLFIDGFETGTP